MIMAMLMMMMMAARMDQKPAGNGYWLMTTIIFIKFLFILIADLGNNYMNFIPKTIQICLLFQANSLRPQQTASMLQPMLPVFSSRTSTTYHYNKGWNEELSAEKCMLKCGTLISSSTCERTMG